MKNIITFILAGIFIVATAFTHHDEKGYRIIGTVTGFPDSTLLYLDDLTDGTFKHMDSTYIVGEKFIFKGALHTRTIEVAIRTKDFSNRCYIWIENSTMYFNAEKDKFKKAIVKGSKTQDEQTQLNILLDSSKNRNEQEFLYVRNNPNSIISAYFLSVYNSTWGRDTAAMLYKTFSKENKESYYGKHTYTYITLNKNVKIGDRYADFSQNDIDNKKISLSDFKGKVVLLEFWGSWCGPCREGNPELVSIYNEFKRDDFEILGVAADTKKEQWLEAVKTDKLPWTNVTDFNGDKNRACIIYGVSYYPTNFLIDKTGIIIGRDLTGEKLRAKLKEIL